MATAPWFEGNSRLGFVGSGQQGFMHGPHVGYGKCETRASPREN